MKRSAALLIALLHAGVAFAQVSVRDFAGREVTLPGPAQRIVALAPHIVENLFSAGAGEKLVGVVSYSDFPPEAAAIPRIGSYNAFSLESVVALRPDLVVMWGSGNGEQTLAQLQRLELPVYVSELRELQDIPQSIRRLGTLAGTGSTSELAARRMEAALEELRQRYAGAGEVSVFYEIWNEPLQTINGSHLISQVIRLCGGRNVFEDAVSLAPTVSIESVLLRDPDAIVASGMGEARPEWLDDWRRYPSLRAVRRDSLFFVHPDYVQRPTARIVEGATELCRQLDRARRNPGAQ